MQIPELVDQIVALLHDSPQDLRSCALASHMLASVAQTHLFHEITFGHRSHERYISPRRLRSILARSPKLIPCIRRIKIHLNDLANAEVSALGLSHVEDIRVVGESQEVDDSDIQPTIDAARRLVGLASVRRVEVCIRFRDKRTLGRLFGDCTPNLREVIFNRRWFPQTFDEGVPQSIAGSKLVRTQLTYLVLANSWSMPVWLLDVECPLDVSKLVDVDVTRSMAPDDHVQALLNHTRHTIQRLAFSMGAFGLFCDFIRELIISFDPGDMKNGTLDLTRFPALTHITAESSMDHLRKFPSGLAGIDPHNTIREILFTSEGLDERAWAREPDSEIPGSSKLEGLLRAFDSQLMALPLLALQRIEIQVQESAVPRGGVRAGQSRTKASLLREWLPGLDARGVLVVTSY
ncbi:hypothetical protein C8R44DRAFT_866373 [Mycena epipterygia]|nr:hypothetical protein C8R44DRAFT_866373 [Mycena epipterygia]